MYLAINMNEPTTQKASFGDIQFWPLHYCNYTDTSEQLARGL